MSLSQRPDIEIHLAAIRDLGTRLKSSREEYEFKMPALVSHAQDYASDRPRLKRYAGQVIGARAMQFYGTNLMKTHFFIEMYLNGIEQRNPYSVLMAARSQIEVAAVVWDIVRIFKENAGDHEDRYLERVIRIDTELITATYGTRSDKVKELLPTMKLSRLRNTTINDMKTFEARNILTRVERLSKSERYEECREDYERLCEYLHPNLGQNLILLVNAEKSGYAKLTRIDPMVMSLALSASASAMNRASTLTEMLLQKEFGPPFECVVSFTRADDLPGLLKTDSAGVGRNEACPCGSGRKFKKCCGN
jgi:hypothetical protein